MQTVMAMAHMLRASQAPSLSPIRTNRHLSGTAAGGQYGVAKKARIIAVKVISDEGCVWSLQHF